MLIRFAVENYRCFKNKVVFDMAATADKRLSDNINSGIGKNGILKTAAVYGSNASGKTTLFSAIQLFRNFVVVSGSHGLGASLNYMPFEFDPECKKRPTVLEMEFSKSGIRYMYGFSYNKEAITEEHLYTYPNGRPRLVFERKGAAYEFRTNIRMRKQNSLRVDDKKLYLSVASQFNDLECKEVMDWFMNNLLMIVNYDVSYSMDVLTNRMNSDRKFDSAIKKVLKMADFGISDVRDRSKITRASGDNSIQVPIQDIWVEHTVNGMNYSLPIVLESSGTIRFMSVIGPVIESLLNGYTIIIDEMDMSFHSDLCRWIVGLFLDPAENKNDAQLIFNTHDVELLDQDIVRRDQIWFTTKNWETKDADLTRLSDFRIRNDLDIRKAYLNGSFGAKPFIEPGTLME